jgi:hypothetical protein
MLHERRVGHRVETARNGVLLNLSVESQLLVCC